MMMQINADEAQAHLSRLLVRVEGGEEFVIEKSGVPVAKLIPISNVRAQQKSLVEQHVAESKQQIQNGQFFGPFSTAEEAIESLHKNSRRRKSTSKPKTR